MAYEKTLSLIVQAVVGKWDEEGNLIDERLEPPFKVFWPFGENVDRQLLEREREFLKQAREGLRR